jgi:hypothetical protein
MLFKHRRSSGSKGAGVAGAEVGKAGGMVEVMICDVGGPIEQAHNDTAEMTVMTASRISIPGICPERLMRALPVHGAAIAKGGATFSPRDSPARMLQAAALRQMHADGYLPCNRPGCSRGLAPPLFDWLPKNGDLRRITDAAGDRSS